MKYKNSTNNTFKQDTKTFSDVPDGYDSPQGRSLYKRLIDASNYARNNPNSGINITDLSDEEFLEIMTRSHS